MPTLPPQLHDWVPVAHDVLKNTAARYQRTITHRELADEVQRRSGVPSEKRHTAWIGPLLDVVALHAQQTGEPPLTSLAVRGDGTVGDGYARAAVINGVTNVDDLDTSAAQHRLDCYRRYASDLPFDGGSARLTKQLERKRLRAEKMRTQTVRPEERREAPQGRLCPTCFVQMPLTGRCEDCE